MNPNTKPRKCGSCNLCCQVFEIKPLAKPAGIRCQHLAKGCTNKSCTIYEQRPEVCAGFKCLWLEGAGPASLRPDRSGVVLTLKAEEKGGTVAVFHGTALNFKRVTEGARRYLDALTSRALVVLIAGDRRKLLGGPRQDVERIMSQQSILSAVQESEHSRT